MKSVFIFSLSLCLAWIATLTPSSAFSSEVREFEATAVEINGSKFWLPSTIYVKKGDTVKIHLSNIIPAKKNNIHGFKIPDFNVEALVDEKGKDVEFVANKTGIFKIICHLHPTHKGGQLVVVE
jgi:plastocyanin